MTDANERLAKITDSALKDLIERMRAAADTSKAPYSLAELLIEQDRRLRVGIFPTVETARTVLELAGRSEDGVVTFGAVWHAFLPDKEFKGNSSQNEVTNALSRVGYYCIRHGLPQIQTLVVNKASNDLTEAARDNVYNAAKERGVEVGPDRDAFIAEQQRLSRQLVADQLPAD